MKHKYNGWLFRWARHFWCGMIYGHEWKNTSPILHGIPWVCQECVKCGKERVI